MHTRTLTYTYTHTYILTHTHTHTHTHTQDESIQPNKPSKSSSLGFQSTAEVFPDSESEELQRIVRQLLDRVNDKHVLATGTCVCVCVCVCVSVCVRPLFGCVYTYKI
jgi:hypothetical protein